MGFDVYAEFDRQVQNLLRKKYHKPAGMSEGEFTGLIQPLRFLLGETEIREPDVQEGYLPFVIVIKNGLVTSEEMMRALEFNGKSGKTKLDPLGPQDFTTIESMSIPETQVYLLIDIDRGKESINIRPEDAFKMIQGKHRFPLTIDEGIAIVTQFPEFLIKNNCFSLLASRTGKDQRVPAIWINAKKEANLGWCWDRNPHTWLGSASGKLRRG